MPSAETKKPAAKKKQASDEGSMPVTGHLREMRNRILVVLAVFLVGSVVCLSRAESLVKLLTDMGESFGYVYVFIAPQELLMQYFKISLIASAVITLPILLYQMWAFARPGLSKRENFSMLFVMIFGMLCFLVGILFAYKVTLPFMLRFLISLNTLGTISASISVESYINFLLTVFIIFGCVFEMPLLSVILSRLGLVTPQLMRKGRGVAIVAIFVVAAIITPPDIFSQIMVALPMILLYELSIALSYIVSKFVRKKEKEEDEEDEEEDDD